MITKPKILIYTDCYLFGGSEYVVVNILKNSYLTERFDFYFSYRKHSLYRSCLAKIFSPAELDKFHPLGILSNDSLFLGIKNKTLRQICKAPFKLILKSGIYKLINRIIFKRLLKGLSPDLVYVNNGGYPAAKTCLNLAILASKMNLRVIMQVNNIAKKCTSAKDRKIDTLIAQAVSTFITASDYAKSNLANKRDFSGENIIAIPNMIKLKQVLRTKEQIYKELGIKSDTKLLIEVALLQNRKGQLELLKAIEHIKNLHPAYYEKLFLLLIGNGENEKKLRKYIKDHSLEKQVTMLGYRFDYLDYICASDTMLLPSLKDEDMPLILLEAMALGKSIISTNLAGIPEIIAHKESGLLINIDSPNFIEELAESIIMLLKTNDNILGKNAKERYDKTFTEEKYVKAIEQVILKTIQK